MDELDVLIKEALEFMDCEKFLSENLTDEQKKKLAEIKERKNS